MTSTLTHLLTNFQPEQQPLADYTKLMKAFIWSGRPQVQNRRLEQPIGRGGINLISIPDFIASVRIRWFRQICKGEIEKHNWLVVLQSWLKELKLMISDIPKLGYHDLGILAQKLKIKGLVFWSQTIGHIAQAMEIWERQTDNITALPIFGGIIAGNARANGRAKWLSVFKHPDHIQQKIFPTFKLVGDLFQSLQGRRVNLNRMKEPQLEGLIGWAKMIFNNIRHAVAKGAS
jgi:hypothetical protein